MYHLHQWLIIHHTLSSPVDWQVAERLSTSLNLFHDWLRDSVANVSDQGDADIAQRINLDQARSKGLELSLEYLLANDFNIELKSLLVDTEVRRCPENTSIVGNRFAQAPNHRSTASFSWTPSSWEFRLDARHESNRYDDALNSRLLDNCLDLDVSLSRRFSKNTRMFLTVNNITNEEIQTHRSAEGLVYVEAPRNWLAGLDWKF